MLQYPDLSLNDISYYWGRSLLMVEINNEFKPCIIHNISNSARYPIRLDNVGSGGKIISLSLKAFIRRVLVHHPAVGYGDYNGVPLYLSPKAGRERRKGVDIGNMSILCPLDWGTLLKEAIKSIRDAQRLKTDKDETSNMSASVQRKYATYRNILSLIQEDSYVGFYKNIGKLSVSSRTIIAKIMEQCVNNNYMSIKSALTKLRNNRIHGVSIARDFALLNTADCNSNHAAIYFLQSHVGYINKHNAEVSLSGKLSDAAKLCIKTSFDKIGKEDNYE